MGIAPPVSGSILAIWPDRRVSSVPLSRGSETGETYPSTHTWSENERENNVLSVLILYQYILKYRYDSGQADRHAKGTLTSFFFRPQKLLGDSLSISNSFLISLSLLFNDTLMLVLFPLSILLFILLFVFVVTRAVCKGASFIY